MPAHITVLYPFAPPAAVSGSFEQRLGTLFESVEVFDFALSEIGWFDDRVMYLAPAPRTPFVELTGQIAAAFPDYPPYGGDFDDVVPHMTVGEGARPARLRRAARRVQRHLPIAATATEVCLMAPDRSGFWAVTKTFPLGRAQR